MAARIGLVLGAGGATGGAFHAGVLSALAAFVGWDARDAEIIVGTSAGSVAGAALRAGMSADDLFNRSCRLPLSDEGRRIVGRAAGIGRGDSDLETGRRRPVAPDLLAAYARAPRRIRLGTLAAAALPSGRNSPRQIADGVGAICQHQWPNDPLWVCALRLSDGRRVVFGRDAEQASIGEAVAASCAIPGHFSAVAIDGVNYVDGGMYSACNLSVLAGLGLDAVFVCAPMSTHPDVVAVIDLPIRRYLKRQLARESAKVQASGTPVVVFAPSRADLSVMGANPMAPGREASVARQVRETTLARISKTRTISALLEPSLA